MRRNDPPFVRRFVSCGAVDRQADPFMLGLQVVGFRRTFDVGRLQDTGEVKFVKEYPVETGTLLEDGVMSDVGWRVAGLVKG